MPKTILCFAVCWIFWSIKVESPVLAQDFQLKGFQLKRYGNPFEATIRPILEDHCAGCHDPGSMKGLDFMLAQTEDDLPAMRGIYAAVVEQMLNHKMPPGDDISLSEEDREQVTDWLSNHLKIEPAEYDRIAQYVIEIYQAKSGILWLGTVSEGLARLDGQSLKYFTTEDGLPDNTVISLVEDKDGTLWVGTQGGIAKFDGTSFTKIDATLGLPSGEGNVFIDRNGQVWANLNQGIYRLADGRFSEFKLPIDKESIQSYAIVAGRAAVRLHDRDGNLWISTDGYGALKYDGKDFQRFTVRDGLSSNVVNDILEDKEGNLWFACMQSFHPEMTGDGGLSRFDGNQFKQFAEIKGLTKNDIYTIFETKSGDLWIGATGVGAYRHNGTTFTLFDQTDRPQWTRNFGVQEIAEDRNGDLWFGFSGGLFQFNGKAFENVGKADLRDRYRMKSETEPRETGPTEPAPFLTTPENWLTEQIPFPLGFAPSINFTGYEDIRFAPGWAQASSPEFWTYKFAWLIEENPRLDEDKISRLLEAYFDGLCGSVNQNRNNNSDPLQESVAVFVKQGDGFRGRLRIFDAFTTKKWISLNATVKSKKFDGKTSIEFEFSPQTFEHQLWQELGEITSKASPSDR